MNADTGAGTGTADVTKSVVETTKGVMMMTPTTTTVFEEEDLGENKEEMQKEGKGKGIDLAIVPGRLLPLIDLDALAELDHATIPSNPPVPPKPAPLPVPVPDPMRVAVPIPLNYEVDSKDQSNEGE